MGEANLIWVSANRFGYALLEEAVGVPGFNLEAIVTLHPDATTVMYDGIDSSLWKKFNAPVFFVRRIEELLSMDLGSRPDWGILCGWRQRLSADVLGLPRRGFAGFHPSLLPYGRGPAPLINTLLLGLSRSGVTLYHLTPGLDDGDIIGQEEFSVAPTDHAGDLYDKAIDAGRELIRRWFSSLLSGNAPRIPQDPSGVFVFPKPTLADNEFDFRKDSLEVIDRKIRAFSKPYRGAFVREDGQKLTIWRSELAKG